MKSDPKIPTTSAAGRTPRDRGEFSNRLEFQAKAIELSTNGIASKSHSEQRRTNGSNAEEIFNNLFEAAAQKHLTTAELPQSKEIKRVRAGKFSAAKKTEFGRTTFYQTSKGVAKFSVKKRKEEETLRDLTRELEMQSALASDKHFLSAIPKPLGIDPTKDASIFAPPEGYYDYLSQIDDRAQFSKAACTAAYDLGYLLKKYGLVFPNLISVFHAKERPYTLLPQIFNAHKANFGGLPGKIGEVVGEELYENIGRNGLRDLGDLEKISDYKLTKKDGDQTFDLHISEPQKVAHFISLYLMVFTILIGNRARRLQKDEHDLEPWRDNDIIFSSIMKSLFWGMGIELSHEELSYLDPSMLEEKSAMQPSEKFNSQLYFSFTQFKDQVFPAGVYKQNFVRPDAQQTLQEEYYGTPRARFNAENFYSYVPGKEFSDEFNYSSEYGFGTSAETAGYLGNYSGVNPLLTACKYSLRASQFALLKLYDLPAQLYPHLQEVSEQKMHEKTKARDEAYAAAKPKPLERPSNTLQPIDSNNTSTPATHLL